MSNRLRALYLGLATATTMITPAFAVDLTVICRCVVGGVNSETATWIKESVIPGFTAAMKAEGKDVTVSLNEFGGKDEQMTQQLALDFSTGAGADVAAFDGFLIPSFVEGGLLKPLDEVAGAEVNNWEGWSHISEGSKSLMSYGGKPYGLALGTDVRAIFVRKELLKSAGLDPDTFQPKSWAELLDAARAIKKANPDSFPLQLNAGVNMGEATTMQGYLMALLGAGQHIYDFEAGKWIASSPAILDTLNLYQTIYVTEELGDARYQLTQDGRDRSFEDFSNGTVAMLVEGDYLWRGPLAPVGGNFPMEDRDELVSFAMMPAIEPGAGYNGQDFVTISGGTGFILNPNTEHPEEAWALLSYMFSREALEGLQELQPRIRARTDVPVTGDETMSRIAEQVLPLTTIRPQLPEYNQVSAEAQLMTERVVSGEMSPEEAMAAFDEAVTALVGEENVIRIPIE